MRRRLLIAGDALDALELLSVLESNPGVEIVAIVSDDPEATRARLVAIDVGLAQRFAPVLTRDLDGALATPGLVAVIDGDASPRVRGRLQAIRGLQVVTPGLARTLFGFGPVDAFSKPDLLQILREILLSAELTRDQRSVLDMVLQVAVAATGADRGSLLLWDEREGALRVAASLGIEEELLAKIRVAPGEGIAGKAFAERHALLLHGKADRHRWQILRERDDVESAISAPLLHGDRVLGVLNLSHARSQRLFDENDLHFVEELARLDARILARAEEFDQLLRESRQHRLESELRRTLARSAPFDDRLDAACTALCSGLGSELVELWLCSPESRTPILRATSAGPRVAPARPGPGIVRIASDTRRTVWLAGSGSDASLRFAAIPLLGDSEPLGVLLLQGSVEAGDDPLEARWSHGAQTLAEGLRDALTAERAQRASQRGIRLAEAMAALTSCRDASQLHDLFTSSALVVLDARDAVLRLRQEGSSRFPVVAWSGSGACRRPPLSELERKLAADAMRGQTTVRLRAHGEASAGPSVTPVIVRPLVRDGWVVGSLCVLGRAPGLRSAAEGFDAAEEDALAALTRHGQATLAALGQHAPAPPIPTAFPDRRQLHEHLAIELARSRTRGHRVLLVEIEVPGLEALRTVRGEPPAVGEALRDALREFDLVARVGEDRFAVLLPEPEEETAALLARLHRALREVLGQSLEPIAPPRVRMGYAVFPDDGGDPDVLAARAAEPRVEAS